MPLILEDFAGLLEAADYSSHAVIAKLEVLDFEGWWGSVVEMEIPMDIPIPIFVFCDDLGPSFMID